MKVEIVEARMSTVLGGKTLALKKMAATLVEPAKRGETSSYNSPEMSGDRSSPQSLSLSVFNLAVQTMYIKCVWAGCTHTKFVTTKLALAVVASLCASVAQS